MENSSKDYLRQEWNLFLQISTELDYKYYSLGNGIFPHTQELSKNI